MKLHDSLMYLQVIRRRVVVPSMMDPETPLKITLEKKSKKDGEKN